MGQLFLMLNAFRYFLPFTR